MVALQQVILESTLRYVLNQSVLLIVIREKKSLQKKCRHTSGLYNISLQLYRTVNNSLADPI